MEFKEEEEDMLPVSFIVFLPVILLGIGFLSPNHIGIRASPVSPWVGYNLVFNKCDKWQETKWCVSSKANRFWLGNPPKKTKKQQQTNQQQQQQNTNNSTLFWVTGPKK